MRSSAIESAYVHRTGVLLKKAGKGKQGTRTPLHPSCPLEKGRGCVVGTAALAASGVVVAELGSVGRLAAETCVLSWATRDSAHRKSFCWTGNRRSCWSLLIFSSEGTSMFFNEKEGEMWIYFMF